MQGKVNEAYRVWYTLKLTSGAPATSVAGVDQTVTIRDPGNSATMAAPTIVEFGGGLYYFDISASFTNTNGAGQYGGTIEVSSASPVLVDTLPVNVDFYVQDIDDSVWDETAASHIAAGSTGLIHSLTGYLGAVWIDSNNGTAGTVTGVNGTASNPVDTLADAITIAGNIGVQKFVLITGSFTLLASLTEWFVEMRDESELLLNGQNVNGTEFVGGLIKGIGSGTIAIRSGHLEDVSGLRIDAQFCGLSGTIGLAAGTSTMDLCHSDTPGIFTPTIDFTGAGRQLNLRGYSGGIAIENMASADNISTLEFVAGQLIISGSCTAGTLVYRGNVFPVTNNSAGTTIVNNSTAAAVDGTLSTVHGAGSWESVTTSTTLEGHSVTQMNANPGQTVSVTTQVLNANGERVDGYIPQIDYIIDPSSSMASGYPLAMTRETVGVYSSEVSIPTGILAIGTYIVSVSWSRPGTALTQYEVFLINVSLAFGNASVSPG
jgi:hypothetical protein